MEWTMGGGEWPKDGAAALIPEFKEGTISKGQLTGRLLDRD